LQSYANHSRAAGRTGIEAHIERTISVQPTEGVSRRYARAAATEFEEIAHDQNLAVGLQRQPFDVVVRTGIKAGVDCAVGIGGTPLMIAR
jgi:hypothetical protein